MADCCYLSVIYIEVPVLIFEEQMPFPLLVKTNFTNAPRRRAPVDSEGGGEEVHQEWRVLSGRVAQVKKKHIYGVWKLEAARRALGLLL